MADTTSNFTSEEIRSIAMMTTCATMGACISRAALQPDREQIRDNIGRINAAIGAIDDGAGDLTRLFATPPGANIGLILGLATGVVISYQMGLPVTLRSVAISHFTAVYNAKVLFDRPEAEERQHRPEEREGQQR
jgi:hypothetical protein